MMLWLVLGILLLAATSRRPSGDLIPGLPTDPSQAPVVAPGAMPGVSFPAPAPDVGACAIGAWGGVCHPAEVPMERFPRIIEAPLPVYGPRIGCPPGYLCAS
jgi:hypothetical protein